MRRSSSIPTTSLGDVGNANVNQRALVERLEVNRAAVRLDAVESPFFRGVLFGCLSELVGAFVLFTIIALGWLLLTLGAP